jgi:hypothetical protein
VDAYWGVAQERMRYAEALERREPHSPAAAYRDVRQDYRLRDWQAIPDNENRIGTVADAAKRSRRRAPAHVAHPWPSEIAKANRQNEPERGHDKSDGRDDGSEWAKATEEEKLWNIVCRARQAAGERQDSDVNVQDPAHQKDRDR